MIIENIEEKIKDFKSMADIARWLFNKENYTNREKCKKILAENGIDWKVWVESKKKIPNKCLCCGKELIGPERYRKKFCNHSCSAKYNNKFMRKIDTVCLNCGTPLHYHAKKYCSFKCTFEHQYKTYIQNWKEGKVNGGKQQISDYIRKYLFKKYNNKCQLCGWSEINLTTNRIPLQVHHIDGDCTNNKEENLQLLCPNCHSLTPNYGYTKKHVSKRVDKRLKRHKNHE